MRASLRLASTPAVEVTPLPKTVGQLVALRIVGDDRPGDSSFLERRDVEELVDFLSQWLGRRS